MNVEMDESKKWVPAGPMEAKHQGVLFCEAVSYNPYKGRILMPGKKNQQAVFRVISVGEGVVGYEPGDLVVTEKCFETVMGVWIRTPFIYGKLPAKHAATSDVGNGFISAVARTPEEAEVVGAD
jgi:hypothetical protein